MIFDKTKIENIYELFPGKKVTDIVISFGEFVDAEKFMLKSRDTVTYVFSDGFSTTVAYDDRNEALEDVRYVWNNESHEV